MWCFNIRDLSHLINESLPEYLCLNVYFPFYLKGLKPYAYWICNVIMFYRGGKNPCTALTFIYYNPLCTGCNNSQ